jgi:5-methylthioadenosine/S-adenosylhomocysteine deaminase
LTTPTVILRRNSVSGSGSDSGAVLKHFVNAKTFDFLVCSGETEDIIDIELYVQNGVILSSFDQFGAKESDFEDIDCGGNLLIPGFVNMHTHSGMTFLRSRADDTPLQEWLTKEIFPNEAKLQDDDVYWFTKLAMLEYLSGGTSTIFDMYLNNPEVARAARDMGVRTVLCGSVNDFGGTAQDLQEDLELYGGCDLDSPEKALSNGPADLVSFKLGFHAEYTTSRPLLEDIVALSDKLKQPVWTHLCETQLEVQECVERTGMTPIAYLESLGMWENGGGGFHGVHLSDEDLKIAQRRNLTLVSCPCSNLKLASGIAPLQKYADAGINLCLGTDGPASNNQLSMFKEMYNASVLQKNLAYDPTIMRPSQIVSMATLNALSPLKLAVGLIEPECFADFTVINLNLPNTVLNDPLKNLVYSCDTSNVVMTVVNGFVLYNHGEYTLPSGETPVDIYKECQKRSQRLFG